MLSSGWCRGAEKHRWRSLRFRRGAYGHPTRTWRSLPPQQDLRGSFSHGGGGGSMDDARFLLARGGTAPEENAEAPTRKGKAVRPPSTENLRPEG